MQEIEHMLSHFSGLARAELYAQELGLKPGAFSEFCHFLLRRTQGFPLQYLIGKVAFMDLELKVRPGVFIPRPETELLVEVALGHLREKLAAGRPLWILDIGTGSGSIALSVAHYLSEARVVATDCSPEAVALAQENADRLGLAHRMHFQKADLWPLQSQLFDAIVSNPPYVASSEFLGLSRELTYEPRMALSGGEDGLEIVRRILARAGEFLREGGMLFLEIGHTQAAQVKGLLQGQKGLVLQGFHFDYQGWERIVVVKKRLIRTAT
jgi:release factor glutamine methyltransferase